MSWTAWSCSSNVRRNPNIDRLARINLRSGGRCATIRARTAVSHPKCERSLDYLWKVIAHDVTISASFSDRLRRANSEFVAEKSLYLYSHVSICNYTSIFE